MEFLNSLWVLVPFCISSTLLLAYLSATFGRRIQILTFLVTGNETASLYVYHTLLLPGTIVHELSHWLAATLLGVKTAGLSLRPQTPRRGQVQFGALKAAATDPARESLIGIAPLFIGSLIILAVARHMLAINLVNVFEHPFEILRRMGRAQDAGLKIYLILAIGNAMIPSSADLRSWRTVGIGLIILLVIGLLIGALSRIFPEVPSSITAGLESLAAALGIAIVLDLMIIPSLWIVTYLLSALLGRRVHVN